LQEIVEAVTAQKNKHAYLVIAHHDFAMVKALLEDLDDERNDIFLHIDAKAKTAPLDDLAACVKKGTLYFTPRMSVQWGGYSQIACALLLLEDALAKGPHQYYHLMTGATFPLRSQNAIHDFFEQHEGYEFVGFANTTDDFLERAQYVHLFNEMGKPEGIAKRFLWKLRGLFLSVQRLARRNAKTPLVFKRGLAYWSITSRLARAVVEEKGAIEKMYRHSFCCDEVFMQTFVHNSGFYQKVFDPNNEFRSCLCMTQWDDPDRKDLSFHREDLPRLRANRDCLFALKFESAEGFSLTRHLKELRE